jgi:hypothetical protein
MPWPMARSMAFLVAFMIVGTFDRVGRSLDVTLLVESVEPVERHGAMMEPSSSKVECLKKTRGGGRGPAYWQWLRLQAYK